MFVLLANLAVGIAIGLILAWNVYTQQPAWVKILYDKWTDSAKTLPDLVKTLTKKIVDAVSKKINEIKSAPPPSSNTTPTP